MHLVDQISGVAGVVLYSPISGLSEWAWNEPGGVSLLPLPALLLPAGQGGPITSFYATEMYITHFLEAARLPKVPVLAGRKVNLTLRLPRRPVPALAPLARPGCGLQYVWPAPSCSPLTVFGPWNNHSHYLILSYLILSYLILSYLILYVLICIKIPMNLIFYMALGRYDFDAGKRHYLGHWRVGLKVSPVLGPNRIKIITACAI